MTLATRARVTTAVALAALVVVAGCGQEVRYQLPAAAPTTATTEAPGRTTTPRRTTVPAAVDGTTRTTTARPQWVNVTGNLTGLASECGTLASVWARPDRDQVIAGVARQGLWASDPGVAEWARLGQGGGSAVINHRAQHYQLDPADPNTIYVAGIYGQGAFVSNDNGVTFRALGNLPPSDQLVVDFSDPNRATMLSVTHETLDLRRSTDGGRTWVNIAEGIPTVAGFSLGTVMLNPTTYLLGTYRGTDTGIFRTTDAGATWTRVASGSVAGVPLVRADGSIWWVLEGGKGIVRSTDGGLTWEQAVRGGILASSAPTIIELPGGRLASFSRTVVVSADDGKTWKAVGGSLPFLPIGVTYSSFRKSFYVWRFDCADTDIEIPVGETSIMQLVVEELP